MIFPSEVQMSCNKCASQNERSFKSEFVLNFHELENLSRDPIYVCQDIVVCLDCGHSELTIPRRELERLKESSNERSSGSRGR
jgi:hypothetical protein